MCCFAVVAAVISLAVLAIKAGHPTTAPTTPTPTTPTPTTATIFSNTIVTPGNPTSALRGSIPSNHQGSNNRTGGVRGLPTGAGNPAALPSHTITYA